VEIARALATQPRFILLDEPFAGVDPIAVIEIQRIIGFLRSRGIGVLITDHNVRETLGICDRAYIISEGRVLAEGTPSRDRRQRRGAQGVPRRALPHVTGRGAPGPVAMKPSLQVRLSQHLALTPQLQQSIRLLQLSTLELHQEVEQMLEQNPFLEAEEDAGQPLRDAAEPRPPTARPTRRRRRRPPPRPKARRRSRRRDARRGVRHHRARGLGKRHRARRLRRHPRDAVGTPAAAGQRGRGDEIEPQDRRAASGSLQDHLRAQLAGMRLSPDDAAALQVLIESLDGDGYLADPLDEIAERLAEMLGIEDDAEGRARSCWTGCSAR
jgi:hypothetical protein